MITSFQIFNLALCLKNNQKWTFCMEIGGTGKPGFFILKLGLEPEPGFSKNSGFPPSLETSHFEKPRFPCCELQNLD